MKIEELQIKIGIINDEEIKAKLSGIKQNIEEITKAAERLNNVLDEINATEPIIRCEDCIFFSSVSSVSVSCPAIKYSSVLIPPIPERGTAIATPRLGRSIFISTVSDRLSVASVFAEIAEKSIVFSVFSSPRRLSVRACAVPLQGIL